MVVAPCRRPPSRIFSAEVGAIGTKARKSEIRKGRKMENKSYFEEMTEQDLTLVGRDGLALTAWPF